MSKHRVETTFSRPSNCLLACGGEGDCEASSLRDAPESGADALVVVDYHAHSLTVHDDASMLQPMRLAGPTCCEYLFAQSDLRSAPRGAAKRQRIA